MRKMGIYYWFGYPIENKKRFKFIKEAGFNNVMLWWGDEYADIDGNKKVLPDMARSIGLEVENIHAPFEKINYIWTDSINSVDIVKRYKNCVLDCADYGIPTVVIHITNGDTPSAPSQTGLDRLKCLVEYAEQKGVNIALENLRKPQYLEFIFSNIKSSRLGFCYDSGHENCYTKGANLLNKYGDKLMALHLHDNDGIYDQHKIPGDGTIEWGLVVKKIQSLKYSGAISLEITNEYSNEYTNISFEEFLKLAHEKVKELFK